MENGEWRMQIELCILHSPFYILHFLFCSRRSPPPGRILSGRGGSTGSGHGGLDLMGDKQESPAEAKNGFGWLKAVGGGIGGLVSGAIMMYASPLVDKFVKPPKPVANFEKLIDGTTITFHNRSTGATDGWWDFGDGTALEP